MSANDSQPATPEVSDDRIRGIATGAAVTILAVVLLVVLAIVAILAVPNNGDSAKNIASLVAGTTTVIGTIVGAFVGTRVGSQGKERAEIQRDDASRRAEAEIVRTMVLAASLPPERAWDTLQQADELLARRGLL